MRQSLCTPLGCKISNLPRCGVCGPGIRANLRQWGTPICKPHYSAGGSRGGDAKPMAAIASGITHITSSHLVCEGRNSIEKIHSKHWYTAPPSAPEVQWGNANTLHAKNLNTRTHPFSTACTPWMWDARWEIWAWILSLELTFGLNVIQMWDCSPNKMWAGAPNRS